MPITVQIRKEIISQCSSLFNTKVKRSVIFLIKIIKSCLLLKFLIMTLLILNEPFASLKMLQNYRKPWSWA